MKLRLRDRVQALNTVRERQKIISTEDSDQDIVGVVRQGKDAFGAILAALWRRARTGARKQLCQ